FGIPELREAIAGHYRNWYGLTVPPERIAVTTGSSGAFQTTFLTCFDVGDRVALARPGYGAYKNILAALGCEVVELDCGPGEGFQPPVGLLEAAPAQASLKGLMLGSRPNPTATTVAAEARAALVDSRRGRGGRGGSQRIYPG